MKTTSPDGTALWAPKGQFRVVFVDTFDHSDHVVGDYTTQAEAVDVARKKGDGKQLTRVYVYDDNGREVSGGFGAF